MVIQCTAPIRICDLGGWTDTWFAGHGKVLNIAVFPSVEVSVFTRKRCQGEAQTTIFAENYGDIYSLPDGPHTWTKHPLLEAALQAFKLPPDLHLDLSIFSDAPVGASTGTSAAVSVAVLGALDLLAGASLTSHEIAAKSHSLECEALHLQCGVQDQLSSAYGGINFIEIANYPKASVSPILVRDEILWELESRLLLVYLGKPHSSSAIHEGVIRRLKLSPKNNRHLDRLRKAAIAGKEALLRGDLTGFGLAMMENTAAQQKLDPALLGDRAQAALRIAMQFGIDGFKLNGAGGEGGSVSMLLKAGARGKQELIQLLEKSHPDFRNIPVRLAPYGLRRWVSRPVEYALSHADSSGERNSVTKRTRSIAHTVGTVGGGSLRFSKPTGRTSRLRLLADTKAMMK